MRTAELEIVTYRSSEMIHASKELIYNYAQYSGLEGTHNWSYLLITIADIIQNRLPDQCIWNTPGLKLQFSGIPETKVALEEGRIRYSAQEPHYILREGFDHHIGKQLKAHIGRVTNAIVEEMHEVYKLDVKKDEGSVYLTFPKSQYAKNIEVVTVPIIEAV